MILHLDFLSILTNPWWENLVSALIHSLWQGALVALLLAIVLRSIPAKKYNLRYGLSLTTLLTVLCCGIMTVAVSDSSSKQFADINHLNNTNQSVNVAATGHGENAVPIEEKLFQAGPLKSNAPVSIEESNSRRAKFAWTPWLASAWLLGVLIMLVRLVWLVADTRKLRRTATCADEGLISMLAELTTKSGITRKVSLMTSEALSTPVVFGVFWPVLMLPVSIVSELSPEEIKLILLHELAHLRRHDYLVNLFQMLVEALLFFNPAVWWISRQIRIEREASADAVAAASTGRPDVYARTLADWAEKSAGRPVAVMQGFADSAGRGSLLERVRRLLVPKYQPAARIPWTSLLVVLVLGLFSLATIDWGSRQIVAVAAQILSPQERMKEIEKAQAEGSPESTENWPEKRTFSGTVVTSDGSPLPFVRMRYSTKKEILTGGSSHTSFLVQKPARTAVEELLEHTFEQTLPNGRTIILFQTKGYAPLRLGPFETSAEERVENIRAVFKKGIAGKVRLRDEQGKPLVGGKVKCSIQTYAGKSDSYFNLTDKHQGISGKDGVATIEHAPRGPYIRLDVSCPGFQQASHGSVEFLPGKTIDIVLQRAKPVIGIVIDKQGKPIENARVKVRWKLLSSSHRHGYGPPTENDSIKTDAKGRFVLDTLTDAPSYILHVEADGHGSELVHDIKTGMEDVRVVLGPERIIRGTITGDLSLLRRFQGETRLSYSHSILLGNSSYTDSTLRAIVSIENGIGRFETKNLLPGLVRFTIGSERTKIELTETIDDLELVARNVERPKRTVTLRFVDESGQVVAPSGAVAVGTRSEDKPPRHKHQTLEIEEGRVTFDAFVPGSFYYNSRQMLGYLLSSRSKTVKVSSGDDPLQVDIPVMPAGAISGRVFDVDGKPVLSDRVKVKWAWTAGFEDLKKTSGMHFPDSVELGPDGRFFLSPVPLGGKYRVVASDQHLLAVSKLVEIDGAKPTATVDLKMSKGQMLDVKIADSAGNFVTDVPVNLSVSLKDSFGGYEWTQEEKRDKYGYFHYGPLNPDVGTYSVHVISRRDYRPVSRKLENLDEPVILKLERGLIVTGRLLDEKTSRPIAGAEVYATGGGFFKSEDPTDEQGRFRFSNLPDRPVTFGVGEVRMKEQIQITASQNGKSKLILYATPYQWSKLRVVKPADAESSHKNAAVPVD